MRLEKRIDLEKNTNNSYKRKKERRKETREEKKKGEGRWLDYGRGEGEIGNFNLAPNSGRQLRWRPTRTKSNPKYGERRAEERFGRGPKTYYIYYIS